jgi:hypothetical protein
MASLAHPWVLAVWRSQSCVNLIGVTRLGVRPGCHWFTRRREARPVPYAEPHGAWTQVLKVHVGVVPHQDPHTVADCAFAGSSAREQGDPAKGPQPELMPVDAPRLTLHDAGWTEARTSQEERLADGAPVAWGDGAVGAFPGRRGRRAASQHEGQVGDLKCA